MTPERKNLSDWEKMIREISIRSKRPNMKRNVEKFLPTN